eukprot:2797636-Pyramimonas_sp.AAC.1
MAPALQWSKMIWQAVAFPSDALVGLTELERMWGRVFSQAQSDVSWAQTRGPVSRIPLCLAR